MLFIANTEKWTLILSLSIELSRKKVEQLGRNSPPLSTSKEEASFQFFSCAEKVKASKSYLIKGLKHLGQFY